MKIKTALITIIAASSFALPSAHASSSAGSPAPSSLSQSDWSGIRAAHENWRHRFETTADGSHTASNPNQKWTTHFDGRGFLIEPAGESWRWGLELSSYGVGTNRVALTEKAPVAVSYKKLSYRWDNNLEEWFLNDTRGIEQGWTFNERPEGSKSDRLRLDLAVRGGLKPLVSTSCLMVSFTDGSDTALTYGGLKAWDASGRALPVRFLDAGTSRIAIEVDERDAVYPVTIDPVAQQARLVADNADSADAFGWAVAISGDTVAVAARQEGGFENNFPNSGAVYIYTRSGSSWTQQAYLRAFNAGVDDYFGTSVALSGDVLVVGARGEDATAFGDASNNNLSNSGAVYVYTRSGSTWTIQSRLKAPNAGQDDYFGTSVAVSDNFLFVGAPSEDSTSNDVSMDNNDGFNDGAVYVYSFNGTIWTLHSYLKATTTDLADSFGSSLAVSGNTLAVGAPIDTDNQGRCAVFTYNGSSWSEEAILGGSNSRLNDYFGAAVAISGDTIVVGALAEDSDLSGAVLNGEQEIGAAYVFVRNAGVWTEQAILKASNAGPQDKFGGAVAISGDIIAVGSQYEDSDLSGLETPGLNDSGAVYVYHRSGTNWTQSSLLKSGGAAIFGNFGNAVAFDGNTIIAAALGEDGFAGVAYPFITTPEIAVEGPEDTDLADGSGTIDFGSGTASTTVGTKTFTIRNTGLAELAGLSITKTGSHAANFAVSSLSSTSLAPGDSMTFTVTFTPSAVGARSATLQIASDDADENPFDIALAGTGVTAATPEIVVEQPTGTNLVDGSASLAFGNANTGSSSTKTITIRNTGTANLTGLAVTRSGTHATDFTLGSLGSTTLTPGASTTFTVTFAPGAAGTRTAALQIASNDADENPFNIALGGTGVAATTAPEIVVEQPAGTNLLDGSASVAFGNTNTGSSSAKTFTIRNTGTANLTGLAVTRSGTHASDYTLGSLGSTTLAPGASTTFTVTFAPGAAGTRTAALQIASNDADENPFNITLGGTGEATTKAPEIVVEQPAGTSLVDGSAALDFGNSKLNASVSLNITVRNSGTANLTGLALSRSGTHASDFALGALGSTTLKPGASTTFTVTFTPGEKGARSATLQIASNDADENPFDLTLSGTGLDSGKPEIVVQQGKGKKKNLKDNRSSRDFGKVKVGAASKPMVFTIKNTGKAKLTKLQVTFKGKQAKDFKVVKKPAKSLAPGKSTRFKVIYKPTTAKDSKTTMRIRNNDANENPFRVKLGGQGGK